MVPRWTNIWGQLGPLQGGISTSEMSSQSTFTKPQQPPPPPCTTPAHILYPILKHFTSQSVRYMHFRHTDMWCQRRDNLIISDRSDLKTSFSVDHSDTKGENSWFKPQVTYSAISSTQHTTSTTLTPPLSPPCPLKTFIYSVLLTL